MSKDTVHVGIVGAGANTRARHIPGLRAIPGVEILGVCNRTRESSDKVAREFGFPKVYNHWMEAVDDPDTEAIVIGAWPNLHCRVTLAALDAGKHVLTEARMARNAAEAHAMLDAAQASPHLVTQVVPAPFTLPVDRTVQRLIAEGYLGEILAVECHQGSDFLDREGPWHWRKDFDLSGYNTLALGIWYESIMRWVGEVSLVLARGKVFLKMRRDRQGMAHAVRVPEHVDVVADLACGAQMHLQQSAVTAHLQGGGIYLFGSIGVLRFHDQKLWGARKGEGGLREIVIPPEERGGWRVEEEFVNAIRGTEDVMHTTFEDGVKYMEFTEAVARSMATGRAVPLPLELGP